MGKPDAAVYRHALQALGAAPTEVSMVGDHLEWDSVAPSWRRNLVSFDAWAAL